MLKKRANTFFEQIVSLVWKVCLGTTSRGDFFFLYFLCWCQDLVKHTMKVSLCFARDFKIDYDQIVQIVACSHLTPDELCV